ncbi:MAG: hypothetical protein MOB07_26155 [Acidobacteria bacterium]|nr:hypothetical protein [Acidobacteriota bacterium]
MTAVTVEPVEAVAAPQVVDAGEIKEKVARAYGEEPTKPTKGASAGFVGAGSQSEADLTEAEYQELHAGHWSEPRMETGPDGKPVERRSWVFTDPRHPNYRERSNQDGLGNPSPVEPRTDTPPDGQDGANRPALTQDENAKPSQVKMKPSRDGNKQSVTGRKEKTVTGRNTRTLLKTKPLLRVVSSNPSRDGSATESQDGKPRPSRDGRTERTRTKSRKATPDGSEVERLKRLLPKLPDGRWTVENEGYAWKIRRVWDRGNTTESVRYFRIRWAAWEEMRGVYDDNRIAGILAEKVRDKQRRLQNADAGPVQHSIAG